VGHPLDAGGGSKLGSDPSVGLVKIVEAVKNMPERGTMSCDAATRVKRQGRNGWVRRSNTGGVGVPTRGKRWRSCAAERQAAVSPGWYRHRAVANRGDVGQGATFGSVTTLVDQSQPGGKAR
jgi:hypothetical protein